MLQQYGLQIDVGNELLPVFFVAYMSALMSEDISIKTRESIEQIIADFAKNTAVKIIKLEMKQFLIQKLGRQSLKQKKSPTVGFKP